MVLRLAVFLPVTSRRRLQLSAPPRLSTWERWAVALGAPLVALAAQLAMRPAIYAMPFVLFFLGIAVSSWLGGLQPGLLATACSLVLANYFFIPPLHVFAFTWAALLSNVLFASVAILISVLNHSLQASERERAQLMEALSSERQRLLDLVMKAPAMILVTQGPEHIIEVVNPAFSERLGRPVPVGQRFQDALPELAAQSMALRDEVMRTGQPISRQEAPGPIERWKGSKEEHFYNFSLQPLRDGAGRVTGIASVGFDVTEQVRARRRVEETNRAKDEFLAVLSHELRTPLTAMLGYTGMLRAGSLTPERTRRAIDVIDRSARAQARLIADLLDISQIITGKLRLEIQPAVLPRIIEAAMETVRPAVEAKELRLTWVAGADAGILPGDADRLQQMVWNLLSNAIKFTPRGGQVKVELSRRGGALRLSVADTGEGIAPDFLPYVFDRFRQADASTTRRHGGLGLGLAIVRHIVELHGGTVEAHSPGEGQGAEFVVNLLVAPSAGEALAAAVAAPIVPAVPPPAFDGLRVVRVEDEPDTR